MGPGAPCPRAFCLPKSRRTLVPSSVSGAVLVVVAVQDLPRHVVAVLLRIEDSPTALKGMGLLCAEDAVGPGTAVGDVDPGDLVVPVVLKAVPGRAREKRGVDRRRRVAAQGDQTEGLVAGVRVIRARVEEPA